MRRSLIGYQSTWEKGTRKEDSSISWKSQSQWLWPTPPKTSKLLRWLRSSQNCSPLWLSISWTRRSTLPSESSEFWPMFIRCSCTALKSSQSCRSSSTKPYKSSWVTRPLGRRTALQIWDAFLLWFQSLKNSSSKILLKNTFSNNWTGKSFGFWRKSLNFSALRCRSRPIS